MSLADVGNNRISFTVFNIQPGGVVHVSGDNHSKTISGNFGDINAPINQGDGVVVQKSIVEQTKITNETDKLVNELKQFISSLPESKEKRDAEHDANQMEQAIKENDTGRAKKMWAVLADAVRTSAAGIAIGTYFGWL